MVLLAIIFSLLILYCWELIAFNTNNGFKTAVLLGFEKTCSTKSVSNILNSTSKYFSILNKIVQTTILIEFTVGNRIPNI